MKQKFQNQIGVAQLTVQLKSVVLIQEDKWLFLCKVRQDLKIDSRICTLAPFLPRPSMKKLQELIKVLL